MPIQKTEGIILRRQDLRETSIVLTFYTRDFGKIKGIVRGVRGPRAGFAGGAFEVFALDDIIFYERKSGDIFTISQCDLSDYFAPIRESLEKLSYAGYVVELLDSITSPGDKNSDIFRLLHNSLKLLSGDSSPRRVARIFEIKLLALAGLMPGLDRCVNCGIPAESNFRFSLHHGGLLCRACLDTDRMAVSILPGTVKFMEHVRSSTFERAAMVKVSSEVGRELETLLRRYLDYHIERRLKTVQFMKELFA
ncbi:MAG: DNA repair protein RecO [Candidatus Omnitrophica bacterium]|nr:DNA repair protein RecO [Candidatus Omnitrophota bacterium]